MRKIKEISIKTNILTANDYLAGANRKSWTDQGILAVNLISSPGAGKTAILERLIDELKANYNLGIIQGDLQTDLDAERVARRGALAVQINTGKGCHLDANMITNVWPEFITNKPDLLIIENVGNLVCPTEYDLGEDLRIVVLSTAEGSDKPRKYPGAFKKADVVIINKLDLLPYVDFDWEEAVSVVKLLNPKAEIFPVSAKTGEGMNSLCLWLSKKIKKKQSLPELAETI